MNNNDFLQSFNPAQRAAVEYIDGPSLVIAGAGSGKTRVLTYKIAYLLEHGYMPWQLLALTFTNKAAGEMKQRVATIVGTELARQLWMGTFHSIFLRILRYEHEVIGFSSNFTIYDASDSKSLVKTILKEMQLDDKTYKPATVLSRISNAKNQLVTAEDYAGNLNNAQVDAQQKMPKLGQVYLRYAARLRQADAMDFDDILLYTYLLFDQHEDIRQKYANRFQYVLVDEYQDTNFAQHRIVWQLAHQHQHVCVVGDDAQSIYSFRGANIDNILTFQDIYKGSQLFKLEQNYRSTQTIVEAASSLINKNARQIHKNIFSENDLGEPLTVSEAYSDVEEGQIVVRQLRGLRQREQADYSDFAILYRTNAQSRIFEEELRKNAIPYKIYGGLSFYQRKEIKDVIAYLRVAVNPNDEEALKRIINYPARGIGQTTVLRIIEAANNHGVSLWTVLSAPTEHGLNLNSGTMKRLAEFHDLIQSFIQLTAQVDAAVAGQEIMKRSGIIADVYQDTSPENLSRQENLEEMVNGMTDFVQMRLEEDNHDVQVSDYLSEVSLLSDVDSDKGEDTDKVTLMTIHSAKGLEFPTVFVVGLEEGLFPSQMGTGSPREMEEERRLFYVALTRAERHCFLSYAKSRYRYGKMEFSSPSRFLRDIDSKFLSTRGGLNTAPRRSSFGEVELPWKRQQPPTPSNSSGLSGKSGLSGLSGMSSFTRLSRISKPTPATAADAAPCNLSAGQQVLHQRFGRGIVERIEGTGDNLKATVRFENAGTKQLLLKFAKLQVL
ncbi:MAG: UvrD-helicase domain-containing protein [Bacteroidaceae bacterium]|nr:UvrD-helicase domain-containing protein [Bacteroidaceae bacterium]